jgi:thioredoxin 1
MLNTNLTHITSQEDFEKTLAENENVMVCCGRMGPMCIPVYDVMESLESRYPHVAFRDMAFDSHVADAVRRLPEVGSFRSLPFVLYYRNGQLVDAKSGIQSKQQVKAVLDKAFSAAA